MELNITPFSIPVFSLDKYGLTYLRKLTTDGVFFRVKHFSSMKYSNSGGWIFRSYREILDRIFGKIHY